MRYFALMIDLQSEIIRIQAAAQRRAVSIRSIFKAADLAVSNWARWKSGKTSPTMATWAKFAGVADQIINAPRIPDSDNTAARAVGSSPGPTLGNAGSRPRSEGLRPATSCEVEG
jgi:hypothetical protein